MAATINDREIQEALPKINAFRKASEAFDEPDTGEEDCTLKPWEVSIDFVRLVVGTSYGPRSVRKQEQLLRALLGFEVRSDATGVFMHIICPSDTVAVRLAHVTMSSAVDWTKGKRPYPPHVRYDGSTVFVPIDIRMLVL